MDSTASVLLVLRWIWYKKKGEAASKTLLSEVNAFWQEGQENINLNFNDKPMEIIYNYESIGQSYKIKKEWSPLKKSFSNAIWWLDIFYDQKNLLGVFKLIRCLVQNDYYIEVSSYRVKWHWP